MELAFCECDEHVVLRRRQARIPLELIALFSCKPHSVHDALFLAVLFDIHWLKVVLHHDLLKMMRPPARV